MRQAWSALALAATLLAGCASTAGPTAGDSLPQTPAPAATGAAIGPTDASGVTVAPAVPAASPAPSMRQFAGRLALTIESDPTQHLAAEFELEGDEQTGELRLYGALVGLAAVLQWEPGRAVLIEGERRRVFQSVDWLIERVSGAPVPLSMVFALLNNQAIRSDDWWVEARNGPDDRIRAVRLQPMPRIELLMVLKKPPP